MVGDECVLGCEFGSQAGFVDCEVVGFGFVSSEFALFFDWEFDDCLAGCATAVVVFGFADLALDE